MLANRVLMMRPALYTHISPQIRAFSLARIALEPTRKAAAPPPPPPAPAKGRKLAATVNAAPAAPAKKSAPTATKKAAPVAAAPVTRPRLTEKEREARDKAQEREKLAKAKEREKVRKLKERETEREKKQKAKAREEAKKEREKTRIKMSEAIKKPYPPPPKRPRSGYLLFTTDPNVKRDRGEGVTEDASLASQAWKALSESEREAYNKRAEQARAVYKEDIAKWVSSLNLAQLNAARVNREPGTRVGAALGALPKRPGNAYAFFLSDIVGRQDFRNKVEALIQKEGLKDEKEIVQKRIGLYGRTGADMWKSMSEKEKGPYLAKAEEAKKQWNDNYGHLLAAQKEAITVNLP